MKRNIEDVSLGPYVLTSGGPPMIVAEISGNHDQKLERALAIVRAAAAAGAQAIKLQTYTPDTLTLNSDRAEFVINDPGSPWNGRRLWDLYEQAHTPWDWHAPIFEEARAHGLACISSAFDLQSVNFLRNLAIDAIKISSFEVIHLPLLAEAARSGLPLLVSTGMATDIEIREAVQTITSNGCAEFVMMKCTSAYPTHERDANVHAMVAMRQRYKCHVGLSDHTARPFSCFAATALGAGVLEVHVTLDKTDGCIDSFFSFDPDGLADLVKGVRSVWTSLGRSEFGPTDSEQVSLRERPSIWLVGPVRAGHILTKENLRVVRPSGGMAPKHFDEVIGRQVARDIDGVVPMDTNLLSPIKND